MKGASKLCEMLERACAFPVAIPAYKVDPDVTRTFDFAQDGGSEDPDTDATSSAERGNRSSRE